MLEYVPMIQQRVSNEKPPIMNRVKVDAKTKAAGHQTKHIGKWNHYMYLWCVPLF